MCTLEHEMGEFTAYMHTSLFISGIAEPKLSVGPQMVPKP
jgi:hypothetical protein